MKKLITVIIPVYRKTESFIANLKHNIPFLRDCEIIVVNDYPGVDISGILQPYPKVILFQNKTNLGFGGAVNRGAQKAKGDLLMLINSDVRLNDISFTSGVSHFEKDTSLFAVSFAQMEEDGSIEGKNRLYFSNGFIQHMKAPNTSSGTTAWAEGGSALIRKSMFEAIGGFDPIFSPFYWEDIDLSYRAWKRGWKVYFERSIKVLHHHETTISAYFSRSKIQEIAFRNQLLFMWGSLTDPALLNAHIKQLPGFILSSLIRGNVSFVKGFLTAVPKLRLCMHKRDELKKTEILSDTQIFKILS